MGIEVLRERLPEEFEPILDYFEDNYIGRLQRNHRRRRPLFAPGMWSSYARTLAAEARTNNHAEAAHRCLQAEFGVNHPTLWKFINGLRMVQKSVINGMKVSSEAIHLQENATSMCKLMHEFSHWLRVLLIAKCLNILRGLPTIFIWINMHLVESFANREMFEYLKGIAHNFYMD